MSGGGPISAAAARPGPNMTRLALIALLLLVVAPSAAAQEDGVFVDPDSPAGKEYAVPIDQARGEAAGTANRPPGEEPLFGEGIEPAAGGSGNKDAGEGAGDKGQQGSKREASKREGDASGGDAPQSSSDLGQSSTAIEAAAADGSDGLLSAGIAAAVLAVGLLAGFGLRRLLRSG
jgi:hypothetical protein